MDQEREDILYLVVMDGLLKMSKKERSKKLVSVDYRKLIRFSSFSRDELPDPIHPDYDHILKLLEQQDFIKLKNWGGFYEVDLKDSFFVEFEKIKSQIPKNSPPIFVQINLGAPEISRKLDEIVLQLEELNFEQKEDAVTDIRTAQASNNTEKLLSVLNYLVKIGVKVPGLLDLIDKIV
jgi:hypothetical protein